MSSKLSIIPCALLLGWALHTILTDLNFSHLRKDVGGDGKFRPMYRHYYLSINALVFVIDSADGERSELAKAELDILLGEAELKGVPLLVIANKQVGITK